VGKLEGCIKGLVGVGMNVVKLVAGEVGNMDEVSD